MKNQQSFKDSGDFSKSMGKKDGKMRGISEDKADYFAPDSIRERLRIYTSEGNNGSGYAQASIPSSYFDRYSQEKSTDGTKENDVVGPPSNAVQSISLKPAPNDSSISEKVE